MKDEATGRTTVYTTSTRLLLTRTVSQSLQARSVPAPQQTIKPYQDSLCRSAKMDLSLGAVQVVTFHLRSLTGSITHTAVQKHINILVLN